MQSPISGWLRLWIVLAATYGLIVSWYVWASWPTVMGVTHNQSMLKLMSDDALQVIGRSAPTSKDGWQDAPIIMEMPNGFELELPSNISKDEQSLVAKDYVRVLNLELEKEKSQVVRDAFLVWSIPTVAVLLLGIAFGWVYRGFKRTES